MSDQSDETGRPNANLGIGRERGMAPELKQKFNLPNEYGAQIAALSPEAKQRVSVITQLGSERMDQELVDQRRSHKFRIFAEENRLMKEALQHPDLQMRGFTYDGRSEIAHIEQSAKEGIDRREKRYQQQIVDETKYSIDQTIAQDKERKTTGRTEPDHER